MAGDVVGLLDELGIEKAAYLGYSMGGRIGLQVVLDDPERVPRAVLGGIGSAGAIGRAQAIARAFRLREPTDDPIAQTFYKFASARPTNDLDALAACIVGLRPENDPQRLARIDTPILIVVGDNDQIARGAPELVEQIPSAQLVTILNRDHMSAVPAREFKQAALEFLELDPL
jgi:pimeloyl-ACP methyl ester carboxylesterase